MELTRWQHGRVQLLSPSGSVAIAVAPLNTCGVCYEDAADREYIALEHCGHVYCAQCLGHYVHLKIARGIVHPLCCQPESEMAVCGREISRGDIAKVAPPPLWAKYQRFAFLRSSSGARECPFCGHLQVFELSAAASSPPMCECQACHRTYCFEHSAAHGAGVTCEQFEREAAAAHHKSRETIAKIARRCPRCQSPIEKRGGCDRMCCAVCASNFCWRCGAAIDDDGDASGDAHACLKVEAHDDDDHVAHMQRRSCGSMVVSVALAPVLLLLAVLAAVAHALKRVLKHNSNR